MPKGTPKAGHKVRRVYRPDLSEHFKLVHPRLQLGIFRFNAAKTKAEVAEYFFDADGDMYIGRRSWKDITDEAKGKCIVRKNRWHYLSDMIKPPANPYA